MLHPRMPTITLNRHRIHQLELFARKAPRAYRQKVVCYLMVGYVVLAAYVLSAMLLGSGCTILGWHAFQYLRLNLFIRVVVLGLMGGSAISLYASAIILLRSLTKEIEPPAGIALPRQQAPRLFIMLDDICRRAGVVSIDQVYLTSDFQVSIAVPTRMMSWGRPRYRLSLGVPLLVMLSPLQLQALLGHELGHMAKSPIRLTHCIDEQRRNWGGFLLDLAARQSIGEWLVSRFLWRYVPKFLTYSFALARIQEYRADQFAAQLFGRDALGEALMLAATGELNWTDAVEQILGQANHQPQLPADLFSQILWQLQQPQSVARQQTLQPEILAIKTDVEDTHPCLRDRLMVLGYPREQQRQLVVRPLETAAQKYFGETWLDVKTQCDQAWTTDYEMVWQQHYQQFCRVNSQLEQLAIAALNSPFDALHYARKTREWLGPKEAIPCYQTVLDLDPMNQAVHYELGSLMLEQDDDCGVMHLEEVIRIDPTRIVEICQIIYQYYCRSDKLGLAEKYRQMSQVRGLIIQPTY